MTIRDFVIKWQPILTEKCVITALGALKSPCRVDFTLPDDLAGKLRKVEPGYICGDDLTNALSRHIVDFKCCKMGG